MPSPITDLFAHCEGYDLWHKTIELKRGQPLHLSGDRDGDIYYVKSGTLRSYVHVNGEEQIIRFGYRGDFIVALDTFITGRPTRLSAVAIRKCTLRVIRQADYRRAMTTAAELQTVWQELLNWMVVGQLDREIDLLTNDPAERYRRVLARSPQLFQEIPAKYIANYLRMTPETLSRIRNTITL